MTRKRTKKPARKNPHRLLKLTEPPHHNAYNQHYHQNNIYQLDNPVAKNFSSMNFVLSKYDKDEI